MVEVAVRASEDMESTGPGNQVHKQTYAAVPEADEEHR